MDSCKKMELIALINMVKQGVEPAFVELVSRYTPMMKKVVSVFSGTLLLSDEAFSEACVALHRAALSYDVTRSEDITFGLYARICVYRRLRDLVDKAMREEPTVELDVDLISTGGNIEQNLVVRERMSEYFDKARGVLSEYEYSVFALYIDGYSVQEMSKALGRDVKSVENAKARMLRRLREECDLFSDI